MGTVVSARVLIRDPASCSEDELAAFAALVLLGGEVESQGLAGRIRAARFLASYYAGDSKLVGVAALKDPNTDHHVDVFTKARADVDRYDFPLELGWIYLMPKHRGKRIPEAMCLLLLAQGAQSGVFATARTNNISMIRILFSIGFERAGRPYRGREHDVALFVRPLCEPRQGSSPPT